MLLVTFYCRFVVAVVVVVFLLTFLRKKKREKRRNARNIYIYKWKKLKRNLPHIFLQLCRQKTQSYEYTVGEREREDVHFCSQIYMCMCENVWEKCNDHRVFTQ